MTVHADVVIPTHDHAQLLPLCVASVREQTIESLRIVIIGDGVQDETREVVAALMLEDPRIEFHDLPKAGRTGEVHRGPIVAASTAQIVTYLGDDDLLFPDHVETMLSLLEDADLAHPSASALDPDGVVHCAAYSLAEPGWRAEALTGESLLSLTGLAHTSDAYRRLPYGWRDTPSDVYTDQHMVRQFLEQDWCRVASASKVTTVHLAGTWRTHMTPKERRDELARVYEQIRQPGGWQRYRREALEAERTLGSAMHLGLVHANRQIAALEPPEARLDPHESFGQARWRAVIGRARAALARVRASR